ncbi:MAG TPA: hypothetical protein VNH40_00410, partial [Gaiellaceae bacterium]|nr:hypothetical protein [Gaiellaceae bacterium]
DEPPAPAEPDEDTVEVVLPEAPPDTMVIPPELIQQELLQRNASEPEASSAGGKVDRTARVRLALAIVAVLALALVLLVWGLIR